MRRQLSFCLLLLLQIMAWVPSTSRPFTPNHYTSQLSDANVTKGHGFEFNHASFQVEYSALVRIHTFSLMCSRTLMEVQENYKILAVQYRYKLFLTKVLIESEQTEEIYKGMKELGSRPPNCDHRCSGCTPCVATQVPTVSGHLGIQYANYEPISWKCKCGLSFYSP
ncbi:EPIDERMAL PATTERNING FACTOR-like protein 1 [Amaranthus tricolor]|uniref:EPIDERMAL PATTERNING FACTOR-like protein 1 n=1 Tax=Amaranthus tricolor TaxID=29722 RepID=UPI002586D776|nr:EPIDERMAL PATTERNING FACTOR-like protein 1 [Amaranthus tricolor]